MDVGWWLMVTYLLIGWRHNDVIGWRHRELKLLTQVTQDRYFLYTKVNAKVTKHLFPSCITTRHDPSTFLHLTLSWHHHTALYLLDWLRLTSSASQTTTDAYGIVTILQHNSAALKKPRSRLQSVQKFRICQIRQFCYKRFDFQKVAVVQQSDIDFPTRSLGIQ